MPSGPSRSVKPSASSRAKSRRHGRQLASSSSVNVLCHNPEDWSTCCPPRRRPRTRTSTASWLGQVASSSLSTRTFEASSKPFHKPHNPRLLSLSHESHSCAHREAARPSNCGEIVAVVEDESRESRESCEICDSRESRESHKSRESCETRESRSKSIARERNCVSAEALFHSVLVAAIGWKARSPVALGAKSLTVWHVVNQILQVIIVILQECMCTQESRKSMCTLLVPQILGQIVEVVDEMPQEHTDVAIFPQERISERLCEQVVKAPMSKSCSAVC